MSKIAQLIALELNIKESQVEKTLKLLSEGATVPFIARYRKEVTGNLDEVEIAQIRDLKEKFDDLEKRKKAILKSLDERELLSADLRNKIDSCLVLTELEDLYLPFRPKKRTKALIAKERGLEPLALELLKQTDQKIDSFRYINPANEVPNNDAALAGARDIIAEIVSEDSEVRQLVRRLFLEHASLTSKVVKSKKEEAEKFKDYFDHSSRLNRVPAHRLLAIMRGVNEKYLKMSIRPDEDRTVGAIKHHYLKGFSFSAKQVGLAIEDAYKRLIAPSIENEVTKTAKEKADKEAIDVFAKNLKELLLAAPFGEKKVLAFDPGFRTGAKVVALDSQGSLLEYANLFLLEDNKKSSDEEKVRELCKKHRIEVIAVGNGTAGRETEAALKAMKLEIDIIMVDENGASIYSASETARKEFPDLDLTVRGAVSIGRRLQDPLAELVKIDAKSIGVGQYQHDVDQTQLKKSLDDQVMLCVNSVGVNLNSASAELLTYVSGIGPKIAENVVKHRSQKGSFRNREELKSIAGLGNKAFEQCAGFLRINDGDNPLDKSAVHPESYFVVKNICRDLKCQMGDLVGKKSNIDVNKYVNASTGLETIRDIVAELEKPGRDPRAVFKSFAFDDNVHTVDDLKRGMKLPGIITNVTNFGAFVDIGVHQDGLVHISKICNKYISDPNEVVRVKQQVEVTVLEVDAKRKRISLSMVD
ncbi:MAG: RNA-binding transcriptional accessory protein [Lentisphaeraceae bacterium]|nr:RNA-binding transcriptional accessory protein [Lentisphaeraceae bacterium]